MGNIIAIYSGDLASIPERWKLCDGTNGTPDLKDKFIRGARSSVENPPGTENAGDLNHAHDTAAVSFSHNHNVVNAGLHNHYILDQAGTKEWTNGSGSNPYYHYTSSDDHGHTTNADGPSHSHTLADSVVEEPDYYKLAYIMAEENVYYEFPVNSISMWSGLISEIPDDWKFCDGANGTPDLRDKFIKGAVDDTEVDTEGTSEHTHNMVTSGEHSHTTDTKSVPHVHYKGAEASGLGIGSTNAVESDSMSHSHTLDNAGNHTHVVNGNTLDEVYPQYYCLAFVQKVY